jgi:hypothetical protein
VGHVTSAPPAPVGPQRASGRQLTPFGHSVTTKGDALQLSMCGLGSWEGTCSCTPTRPRAQTRQANLSTTPLQNRCSLDHWLVLFSVGLLVRTTAYMLYSGTLCWPCVAQCSSKMDSLADGSGSSPAEHHGDGTEAGWWAGAK